MSGQSVGVGCPVHRPTQPVCMTYARTNAHCRHTDRRRRFPAKVSTWSDRYRQQDSLASVSPTRRCSNSSSNGDDVELGIEGREVLLLPTLCDCLRRRRGHVDGVGPMSNCEEAIWWKRANERASEQRCSADAHAANQPASQSAELEVTPKTPCNESRCSCEYIHITEWTHTHDMEM